MMLADTGMLRTVTSLFGSSPAFLMRSTRTRAGVEPLPEVTIVFPRRSAMEKRGLADLEGITEPATVARFRREPGGFRSQHRDVGVAAHHLGNRGLHPPGGLRADDVESFLGEGARPHSHVFRCVKQAAQHLVEPHFLRRCRLRAKEPGPADSDRASAPDCRCE